MENLIKVRKNSRSEFVIESDRLILQLGDTELRITIYDNKSFVINKSDLEGSEDRISISPTSSNEIRIS